MLVADSAAAHPASRTPQEARRGSARAADGFLVRRGPRTHVRAYHGHRTISQALVARRHPAMPPPPTTASTIAQAIEHSGEVVALFVVRKGPVAHRTRHHRSLPPVALGIQGAEACVLQSRAAEDQCGEDPEEGAERGATRRLTLTQNLNGRRGRSSAPLSTDLHLDITASWEPCGCVSVYQSSARAARCSCYRV